MGEEDLVVSETKVVDSPNASAQEPDTTTELDSADPDWITREEAENNLRARMMQVRSNEDGTPYGHDWYEVEHERIEKAAHEHNIPRDVMFAAIAAGSPAVPWDTKSGKRPNIALVLALERAMRAHDTTDPDEVVKWAKLDALPGEKPQGYEENLRKVVRILGGEDPHEVLGDVKVGHFHNNLKNPDQHSNDPTIDRWAARALSGRAGSNRKGFYTETDKIDLRLADPKWYRWSMDRYRAVAKETGFSAMAIQGAIWVNIREEAGLPWMR